MIDALKQAAGSCRRIELAGAAVLDPARRGPRPAAVLVIEGDRIRELRSGPVPGEGLRIELPGKFILPGLIDLHAHADEDWAGAALLASGITSIRNPAGPLLQGGGGDPHLTVRRAGPPIDAPGGAVRGARVVASEEELRAAVREQARAGVDCIKLYSHLPIALVRAGVEQAHALGLTAIGDLAAASWTDAARAGIDYLCHAVPRHASLLPAAHRAAYLEDLRARRVHPWLRWVELFDPDGPEISELVETVAERGTGIDLTLVSLEAMLFCGDPSYHAEVARGDWLWPRAHPLRSPSPLLSAESVAALRSVAVPLWEKILRFVDRLRRGGARLLAGSDSPRPWVVPGTSLHRELALLVRAGLSPGEALRVATLDAAAALGLPGELGTFAAGSAADLVVLDRNPLDQISNLESVSWVMRSGVPWSPTELRGRYA